ncbi:hypothetical protein HDK90DRAFT_86072 [Phyllosticta capitalensis]|uniref:Uncharacterized protein n=1 Tax=Phyllosticta capitalensis TaxID=121624 RepID=A0ABR1YAY7_9PEZI
MCVGRPSRSGAGTCLRFEALSLPPFSCEALIFSVCCLLSASYLLVHWFDGVCRQHIDCREGPCLDRWPSKPSRLSPVVWFNVQRLSEPSFFTGTVPVQVVAAKNNASDHTPPPPRSFSLSGPNMHTLADVHGKVSFRSLKSSHVGYLGSAGGGSGKKKKKRQNTCKVSPRRRRVGDKQHPSRIHLIPIIIIPAPPPAA